MPDARTLSDLIGRAYDAAVGDEDWTTLVAGMAQAVGGTSAVLRWLARPAETAVTVNLDLAAHQAYDAYYHTIDPVWPKLFELPPGTAVDDCALVPEPALERTEIYNDLYRQNHLWFCLSWYTVDVAAQPVCLAIYRPRQRPTYTAEELRLLQAVTPHLDRAVQIEGRIAAAADRRRAARLVQAGPELTGRERDCLARIAQGASNKSIARQLTLSVHTVNEYIASAMRKLRASSRSEAVATAIALGLLGP
ncbi:MAG: response regulator transcription factor [Inquilinus sp.]|uniref:response regulator transcription factor n=1 Tax=Inquilinus sp. TaxID=1932117 RepID=UPI003F3E828C